METETKRKLGYQYYIRKIDFKTNNIARNKERHYIMIKGSIKQEDIIIENIYAPNIGAPQYIKQILMDIVEEINSNKIIVGHFNTTFTSVDGSSRQKNNEETLALNDTLD